MPKTRPPHSPEFRRQMVDLVRAGRSPEDLAREFEPTAQSIGNWVVQADKQEGGREDDPCQLARDVWGAACPCQAKKCHVRELLRHA